MIPSIKPTDHRSSRPLFPPSHIMQLPFHCIPCSSSFQSHHPTPTITGTDPTSTETSSSSSSSSSMPITACSNADDTISIQTFPSLPTLHSLFPSQNAPPPPSIQTSLLFYLNTPNLSSSPIALALSSNFLFTASQSSIAVYTLTDLRQVLSLPSLPSAGAVKSLTLPPNAATLFTAHQDGKIRAWSNNSTKIRMISSLPTLSDRLLRFLLPSNYVTVRRHRKCLWIEHADAVSAIAVGVGLLYSVSWDKTLKIWRLSDLKCLESLTAHEDAVNALAVGPDGVVYTGSADKRIRVWAKRSGGRLHGLVATLEKHKSAVNALAVSGDGSVLYSGACDRSILVWEREESANFMVVAGALRGHERAIMCLSTAEDLVFSGSTDRTIRIWRREGAGVGYSCLYVLEGHVRGVRSLAVEAEGDGAGYRVCSGSLDGEVRVWRVRVENVRRSNKE